MPTRESYMSGLDDQRHAGSPCNYSPVTVDLKDTLGVLFLGILSVILLIGWTRAEARYRAFVTQAEITYGNRSHDAR